MHHITTMKNNRIYIDRAIYSHKTNFQKMSDELVAHTAKVSFKTKVMNFLSSVCWCFSFGKTFKKPERIDLGPRIPGKKTLVLDLDETLVHSSFFPVYNYDFIIKFKAGNNISYTSYVLKRPDLEAFLDFIRDRFEVVIFTASVKEYADAVIDTITPWIPQSHRFYRQHCTISNGMYIKDLSLFNRPLDSMIIVDNSEFSFTYHKSNAILVSTWIGDIKDHELNNLVTPLLTQLLDAKDVRNVLMKQKNVFNY